MNNMDKMKVLCELGEWSADPFYNEMCMKLISLIENERPMGKMILKLLSCAENGNFNNDEPCIDFLDRVL